MRLDAVPFHLCCELGLRFHWNRAEKLAAVAVKGCGPVTGAVKVFIWIVI